MFYWKYLRLWLLTYSCESSQLIFDIFGVLITMNKSYFPQGYTYIFEGNNKLLENYCGEEQFFCAFRININDITCWKKWLGEFETLSNTNWRVEKTVPSTGCKVLHKVVYRCHRNTRPESHPQRTTKPHIKHTGCSAKMITVISNVNTRNRNKSMVIETHRTKVRLEFTHNHLRIAADALRYRRPTESIKNKSLEMFKAGHTPLEIQSFHRVPKALETHQVDMQEEYKDEFYKVATDRSVVTEKLRKVFDDICVRCAKQPDEYVPALENFCRRYGELQTDSAIVSSFHNFSLNTSALSSAIRSGKKRRVSLKGSKNIPVQPTALARRKRLAVGSDRLA